jgi:excisionase family DNA binding protein
MLWTVKQAARFLDMELHQTYYLLVMGAIEAVKVGKTWRIEPEAVRDYDKRFPERKNRKAAGNFVYKGSGGFLFHALPDSLPPDSKWESAGVQRRRRAMVYPSQRPAAVLLKKLKPLVQLELFSA